MYDHSIFQFDLGVLRPILDEHEKNQDGFSGSISFLFAKNPWSCDCEIVKDIQDFLYSRLNFLRDAEMLYCQGIEVCILKKTLHYISH